MNNNSLAHTTWNCKYHIVFAPKYRRQVIYRELRADIGKILRDLCERKGGDNSGSRSVSRSYTYVAGDTAEIQRIRNNGVSERKKLTDDIRQACKSEI